MTVQHKTKPWHHCCVTSCKLHVLLKPLSSPIQGMLTGISSSERRSGDSRYLRFPRHILADASWLAAAIPAAVWLLVPGVDFTASSRCWPMCTSVTGDAAGGCFKSVVFIHSFITDYWVPVTCQALSAQRGMKPSLALKQLSFWRDAHINSHIIFTLKLTLREAGARGTENQDPGGGCGR